MKPYRIIVSALLAFASTAALAQTPADAQIIAIVLAANTGDVNLGKLAESKGTSKEVKDFGKEMVSDHSASNKDTNALAEKLHIKPQDDATSKKLKEDGATAMNKLNRMKGADFDKAYIDNEVKVHQTVLDTIDNTLMPNAKNPELKALLEKTRPVIESHLQMAKKIQASMR